VGGAKRTLAYQFLYSISGRVKGGESFPRTGSARDRRLSRHARVGGIGRRAEGEGRGRGGWKRETSVPDSRDHEVIPASILFPSRRAELSSEPSRRSRFDISFHSASSRSYPSPPPSLPPSSRSLGNPRRVFGVDRFSLRARVQGR